MLRFFAEALSVAVGEHEHAVVTLDDSGLAARIARQARMGRRIDVAGPHTLSGLEFRSNRDIAVLGIAVDKPSGNFVGGERRHRLLRPFRPPSAFEFGARGHAGGSK